MVPGASQGNFLYTHFEEICDLMRKYDVSFSLGDGLRPVRSRMPTTARSSPNWRRSRTDADRVEERLPGDDRRPGHVPLHKIKINMDKQLRSAAKRRSTRWGRDD